MKSYEIGFGNPFTGLEEGERHLSSAYDAILRAYEIMHALKRQHGSKITWKIMPEPIDFFGDIPIALGLLNGLFPSFYVTLREVEVPEGTETTTCKVPVWLTSAQRKAAKHMANMIQAGQVKTMRGVS